MKRTLFLLFVILLANISFGQNISSSSEEGKLYFQKLIQASPELLDLAPDGPNYFPASPPPSPSEIQFLFTGNVQTYIVPAGVTQLKVEAWGAQGGGSWIAYAGPTEDDGGLGGYSMGYLDVTPGSTLYIYVGQKPASAADINSSATGGFNGGGDGGKWGGAGGGASDIRVGGQTFGDRVIVAAGGGGGNTGAPNHGTGGVGGGLNGGDGLSFNGFTPGGGGTQGSGGTAGTYGANGVLGQGAGTTNYHFAGGGGGWYGGGSAYAAGGGGGSSFIDGVTSGSTIPGINPGHGMIKLTIECPGDIIVDNDPGVCGAAVTYYTPLGTQTEGLASGSVFPVGITTNTFTNPDCSFNVTVVDAEEPVVDCTQGISNEIVIDNNSMPSRGYGANIHNFSFADPTPPGATVLGVTIEMTVYYPYNCCAASNHIFINSDEIGNPHVGSPAGNKTYTISNEVPNYVKDGSNTLRLDTWWNSVQFLSATITIEYTVPVDYSSISNDPGSCGAMVHIKTPVSSDNCSVVSLIGVRDDGLLLTEEFPVGDTDITWTATDPSGNEAECSFTVTVEDTEDPVITCPPNQDDLSTVAGTCTADVDPGVATATDNCDIASIVGVRDDGMELDDPYPFGTVTITWTATDIHDNTSECEQTITVEHILTVLEVDIDPYEQQYSDLVTFTAELTPWNCSGFESDPGDATGTVEFFIESGYGVQSMGTAPVVDGTATLANVALLEAPGTDPPFGEGVLAPGIKDVRAVYTSTNLNYVGSEDLDEGLLTVTPENADVAYVGVLFQATPAAGETEAEVMLMATVRDAEDGNRGDIRNACVTFYSEGSAISPPIPVTEMVAVGDYTMGVVTFYYTFSSSPSGVYDIEARVGWVNDPDVAECGYYIGGDEAVLVVYEPNGDFITGGGYIIPENSYGYSSEGLIGSDGLKWNYGFNVKYNKKGSKLNGHVNIITRTDEGRKFQIKSNAMASLGVNLGGGEDGGDIAVYTAKANLKEITDGVDGDGSGNLILKMTLTDNGEPGDMDMIGWTLWSSTGGKNPVADELLLSSDWNGLDTDEQLIAGGNLVVHSASDIDAGSKSGVITLDSDNPIAGLNIYPNPFSDRTFFEITAATDSNAKLVIFDATGRKLATLIDQNVKAGQEYRLEYQPGPIANGLLFYTLTIDNEVKTGKLIHRR